MTAKSFEEISPQRKYHGISAQIIAQIKNVRIPFNVDIGVGDVIIPCAEERAINTQLLDFEAPVIKTYSLESTIAEKFDAIVNEDEWQNIWKSNPRKWSNRNEGAACNKSS